MNCHDQLADYHWLTGPDASDWLAELSVSDEPLLAQTARLRKDLSPARTHLLLDQVQLRRRAADKFTCAGRMFLTDRGLQQASDQWVARYKAGRFQPAVPVVDFCCGIGGDLQALARRGPALGVDLDPVMAHLARANCPVPGESNVLVRAADAARWQLTNTDCWHADPDRRPDERRTTRIEAHRPGIDVWRRLLQSCPHAAVKLAPAARLPHDWAAEAESEWISRAGACRQLVAWFGQLARHPGLRAATILKDGTSPPRTVFENSAAAVSVASRLGRFLAEPDPAVLAAGLVDTVAAEHGLERLAPDVAYLTGDTPAVDPALATFEIADVFPYSRRRLKQMLRGRHIGRLEVKKRGVPLDPDQLRRELRVPGEETATLLVTRLAGRVTAILAHRVQPEVTANDERHA